MSWVLEAWADLDSERPLGFAGAGPIRWGAIRDWCCFWRVDWELTVLLLDVIRYLDVQRSERLASEYEHRNGG